MYKHTHTNVDIYTYTYINIYIHTYYMLKLNNCKKSIENVDISTFY